MSDPLHLTPDALASLLADRDGDAVAAFVTDLYERTGRDATRQGRVVTVRGRGGESQRVLVWIDDRGRIERLLGADPPEPDVDAVNAVVATRGGAAGASVAATLDADLLGTEDLHDRLLYAMDRDACQELCREHFGRGVDPQPAPEGESSGLAVDSLSRPRVVLAAVVVCGLLVAGAAGLPGGGTPDEIPFVPGNGTTTAGTLDPGPVTPVGGQGATPTVTPSPPPTDRTPTVGVGPPAITSAIPIDLEDGDGVVAMGDTVVIRATVADGDPALARVFAVTEPFGVERVELTSAGGNLYTGAFVVGSESPPDNGSFEIPIIAEDDAGNNIDVETERLEVNGSNEGSVRDATPPTITSATAIDLEDGDGVVSDGDRVAVSAFVRDDESGVRRADAFPESFGVEGPLRMMDPDDDGMYNTTFRVDADRAAGDGRYRIGLGAVDVAENVNFEDVFTNELELNTSERTPGGTATDTLGVGGRIT